jgi:polyisoprenoid-binding protein YceI
MYGEVEKNAAKDVLDVKRYPAITFVSTKVSDSELVGQLTLHGTTREVRGRRSGDTAEFSLDQRDFGIKPFSAMLGSLKVKPVVTVKITLQR